MVQRLSGFKENTVVMRGEVEWTRSLTALGAPRNRREPIDVVRVKGCQGPQQRRRI